MTMANGSICASLLKIPPAFKSQELLENRHRILPSSLNGASLEQTHGQIKAHLDPIWIWKWAHPHWIWQLLIGLAGGLAWFTPHFWTEKKSGVVKASKKTPSESALGYHELHPFSHSHCGDLPGFRRAAGGLRSRWPVLWLVVDLPLWKMMEFVSWEGFIPFFLWKNKKNVWNHQPARI